MPKKTAILWEGDEPSDSQAITYQELHYEVCKLANGLKQLGVKKGDCVAIYMPMVPASSLRDVGLCSNRCNSFCDLWWIFTPMPLLIGLITLMQKLSLPVMKDVEQDEVYR